MSRLVAWYIFCYIWFYKIWNHIFIYKMLVLNPTPYQSGEMVGLGILGIDGFNLSKCDMDI